MRPSKMEGQRNAYAAAKERKNVKLCYTDRLFRDAAVLEQAFYFIESGLRSESAACCAKANDGTRIIRLLDAAAAAACTLSRFVRFLVLFAHMSLWLMMSCGPCGRACVC